jgi:hypothetical protein
MSTKK